MSGNVLIVSLKNRQATQTVFEQDPIALRQMMPLDRDYVNTLLIMD